MNEKPSISRKKFLTQSGQLLIGFQLSSWVFNACSDENMKSGAAGPYEAGSPDKKQVDSWLKIDRKGMVTVYTGKMELGQGIKTPLMQIAAEELDVDMASMRIEIADTVLTPDERYTAGSASIEGSGQSIREAAATARHHLLVMASKRLIVPLEQLYVRSGRIYQNGKEDALSSYGDLIAGKNMELTIAETPKFKEPAAYAIVGKPYKRDDIEKIATGSSFYIQDMRLPEMVHARVIRPPSYGAKLLSGIPETLSKGSGILKVVRNGDFLGIIAEQEFQAIKVMEQLKQSLQWEETTIGPTKDKLYQHLQSTAEAGKIVEESGSLKQAEAETAGHLEATYFRPYHMHASIGPSCAIALYQMGLLQVWTHSQGVYPLRKSLAEMTGIDEARIAVKGVPGAGCYGHNGADDVAADAVLLALAYPEKPVRLQWMRSDEHLWEPYGPAMVLAIKAGLSSQGKVVSWQTKVWSDSHSTRPGGDASHLLPARYLEKPFTFKQQGISGGSYRNASPGYHFNATQVEAYAAKGPLRSSALRSLGAYANVFALESFMDEIAFHLGKDPVEFRLEHLEDARSKDVIQSVSKKVNWQTKRKSKNRAMGIAFAQYKNHAAYLAVVAEVSLRPQDKTFKLEKLTCTIDAGKVINPDGIKNQTEGGMIQSASWTLLEDVLYDAHGIKSNNWDGYPISRFPDVPDTEVIIIERQELDALGAGEAAQGPTVAAIANALFAATGTRLRELPLKASSINWDALG